MVDEQLSEHFWLSEFLRSDVAARNGIDNTPPADVLANLRRNAAGMEQLRALLSRAVVGRVVPISILSGFRCETLERLLCAGDFARWCKRHGKAPTDWQEYFLRKRHPLGLATDFTAATFGTPMRICLAIAASEIAFDQLIYEHTWCHVSWPAADERPRREVLTLVAGGYDRGILERAAA